MTPEQWIEKAREKIASHQEFIDEVNDMCGSDYSRHRSSMECSVREIKFLEHGIRLLGEKK